MLEVVEARKVALAQDDWLPARTCAERHQDRAIRVGLVLLPAEPHGGILDRAVDVIDDGNRLPGGRGGDEGTEPAFADQGPAALAGTDEVDHVHARPGQLRELEPSLDPPE